MINKRIALIVDVENWAFDIEAKLLKERLKEYYQIDIFYANRYDDDLFLILEDTKSYDMIHFFWRKLLLQFDNAEFKDKLINNNIDYDNYVNEMSLKISTGIYDHLFLEEENIKLYCNIFNKYVRKYYTCSKKLEYIYNNILEYPNPYGTIHDTYDNKLYDGTNRSKFTDINTPLVIGWVGNSNWNIKYKDFKGFHTILEPVLDELINEGYNIKKNYADKNIIFRTNEEMPKYYKDIDICVVVSTKEGTPRPILEAMASGCGIITTDIGIVNEALGPKQKDFIIGSREDGANDEIIKEKLKEAIIKLYNNRDLLNELKEENYYYASNNDIEHKYLEYKKYFDDFMLEGYNIEYLKKYFKGDLQEGIKRLKNGEPVQYIVGDVNFYGYTFKVDKRALIPRFETEGLIEIVEKKISDSNLDIVDLGTGSGCIAITLKKIFNNANIDAVDISKKALSLARENADLNNVDINFIEGDMLTPLNKKYDIIISNPPYISYNEEVQDVVKVNEPNNALYADNNGLYFYEEILKNAKEYLKDNYYIFFEIGYLQGKKIKELAHKYLNCSVEIRKDLNNYDRYVIIESK